MPQLHNTITVNGNDLVTTEAATMLGNLGNLTARADLWVW